MSCLVPAIGESRHWSIGILSTWKSAKILAGQPRGVAGNIRLWSVKLLWSPHSLGQQSYCIGTESSQRNESEDGRDERDIEFVASVSGRWTRQSGADGVAETKNAVEGSATWTTESANGRWWTAGVTSCSNWSSLRDTEHVHGHGALWFGSKRWPNHPDGVCNLCWTAWWPGPDRPVACRRNYNQTCQTSSNCIPSTSTSAQEYTRLHCIVCSLCWRIRPAKHNLQ